MAQRDAQLSVADLISPRSIDDLVIPLADNDELKKAYYDALQAHLQARKRYELLKTELHALSRDDSSSVSKAEKNDEHLDILSLVRRREKLRKLHVIQKAVSSINGQDGSPANVLLDDHIKSRAGELPPVPHANTARHKHLDEADKRLLELKKAILTAKHTIDTQVQYEEDDEYPPEAQLYALQQTRNMLITWVEEQLLIVGDAQAANEQPSDSPAVNGEDEPIPVSKDEIGQIYDQYLNARRRLLQTLQHPVQDPLSSHDDPVEINRSAQNHGNGDKNGAQAVAALPYIAPFVMIKEQEQLLTQRIAATSQQAETTQQSMQQLLRRLADESHLVHPGAAKGQDWARASSEANAAIASYVESRVGEGERAAASAKEILRSLESLPVIMR